VGVTVLVLEGLRVVALALALAPKVVAAAKVIVIVAAAKVVVTATKVAAAIATASTVRSSSTKKVAKSTKELGVRAVFVLCLPLPPARVNITAGTSAASWQEEPLLTVRLSLPPATS